jgi:CPA2 family monovalent cation:H+ antiporter-2
MVSPDASIIYIVLIAFLALLILTVFHFLHQPSVVAYIITGIIIGPTAMGLVEDTQVLGVLGEFGLVILLFFIGMEIDVHLLMKKWRAVLTGTLLQIMMGVGAIAIVGFFLGWDISRIVLLGFVISLSSTAVVLRHLESTRIIHTRVGNYVCGILFAQDIAIAPMIIILNSLADGFNFDLLFEQFVGINIFSMIFYWLWKHRPYAPHPLRKFLDDRENALLFNITVGLGVVLLSAILGLSIGVGAFLAGILVAKHYSRKRIWRQLESIKMILVAAFFMSIGVLIDIDFVFQYAWTIILIVALVLAANTLAYAGIFHFLNIPIRHSLYMAALLAQIGEFSFFLALVGRQLSIIGDFAYQMTIVVIAISLLVSPMWIALFKKLEPSVPERRILL